MNLANKLTIIRIILLPLFMLFMFYDNMYTRIFSLFVFIVAALTDLYDGRIARRYNCVSNFGKFMDPLADKLLVSAAFISFVGLEELRIPAWMVVFIISREFSITGLRTIAVSQGKIISASISGKFKTTSQIITIIVILLILIVNAWINRVGNIENVLFNSGGLSKYYLDLFLKKIPYWLMFITAGITVFSGLVYIARNKDIFKNTE
ncbi:CDP-diacylglycerol--glycerol-3-phosphate 3-phosphatidyltransferase [bacterium]|nr:CDP-diacylglycerol--glycerol-3-phosphate 3-phosphatidyltransferase [bacterium]